MRTGIGISEDLTLPRQQQLAREVEEAGLASLWTNEASGRDALLTCQAWAAATGGLDVGVSVVPVWTRSPLQLAMATATLQEASGGRFVLGLGVSHPGTMGPWHGLTFRRPRTAAADALTILRGLGRGEMVDHDGEVLTARNVRLAISPPPPQPRLYLAAMGPRMLALAGEAADGVLLNWSSPTEVARAERVVRDAARGAGRAAEAVTVATYVRVAVHRDRDAARAALAGQVGRYAALPAYAEHLRRQGLGHVVDALKAAFKAGGADAVPDAVSDEDLAELGWWGSPDDDPRAYLGRYADAGLDHLIARVVPVDDPVTAVHDTLAALA